MRIESEANVGIIIVALLMLGGFIALMVYQLGEVLRANRVYVPPALLALLFLAIMLAFWLIPHDAEAITPIFRHAGR
ncbi:MAG: hypothetical protein JST60_09180 [Chloroflexi bacterium SZAS-1]|nr:hypothetical protein [Chloroflexi bacterium SZAS-1]HNP87237.1 hypothetical protein [Kouleothrix sp.]